MSAVMATGQRYPLDMLMYYDARMGSTLNGLFNFYTNEKMKGYYPFWMFSKLYRLGGAAECETDTEHIYVAAATDGERHAAMLTYFTNDVAAKSETVTVNLQQNVPKSYSVLLLDESHDAEDVATEKAENGVITLTMAPNTAVLLQSE